MATHIARYAKVDTVAAAATGHLTLLTDQTRDAVFLKGRVRCGPARNGRGITACLSAVAPPRLPSERSCAPCSCPCFRVCS